MEKAKKIKSLDGLHPFGKRDVGGFLRNHRRI